MVVSKLFLQWFSQAETGLRVICGAYQAMILPGNMWADKDGFKTAVGRALRARSGSGFARAMRAAFFRTPESRSPGRVPFAGASFAG